MGSAPRTSSAECCFKNRVDAQIRTVSAVRIVSLPGLRSRSVWAAAASAAMAPAAYETLKAHFADTGRTPADYAAIITGDLGKIGHEILTDLFLRDGVDLGVCSTDCGMLIFNPETQDVHAGGSGCGCSASVLCGHILQRMTCGDWPRVLFAATGALMSPTTSQQGESIPGICHAVVLDVNRG